MQIIVKNNNTLLYDNFKFKCALGEKGSTLKKIEGDKKTPKGTYNLGPVYYREDRISKIDTQLQILKIKKTMGWCDDVDNKNYNKIIKINKNIKHEKLFRKSRIYDILIPINYNTKNIKKNKGSAIFIHLTKKYKKTLGCIAVSKKDMLILLKLINKKTKIKIY
tara:strand:- start:2172 stop:2663 length:492 start_codon:yes stop_codon:yes gene_type:complete